MYDPSSHLSNGKLFVKQIVWNNQGARVRILEFGLGSFLFFVFQVMENKLPLFLCEDRTHSS